MILGPGAVVGLVDRVVNGPRRHAGTVDTGRQLVGTAPDRQPVAMQAPQLPPFDDEDRSTPINGFREYPIPDYRALPNCLTVLGECVAVQPGDRTSEQYMNAMLRVARRPCRVVLKLVDVSATYDLVDFELLADDGGSGLPALREAGDLGGYTKHLKEPFSVQGLKAKRVDTARLSKGGRVVLVGLGDVGDASSWGAAAPRRGLPKGSENTVILRAFGASNKYRPSEYDSAFMVRNWYVAAP